MLYEVVQSFPRVEENVQVDSYVSSHRWRRHSESLKSVDTNRASMGQDSSEPGGFTDLLLEEGHDNATQIEVDIHSIYFLNSFYYLWLGISKKLGHFLQGIQTLMGESTLVFVLVNLSAHGSWSLLLP